MATKRELKRGINNDLGDLITLVYDWELGHPKEDKKASEAIIDEAINTFDTLVARVNQRKIENASAHFKTIKNDLATKVSELHKKVKSL